MVLPSCSTPTQTAFQSPRPHTAQNLHMHTKTFCYLSSRVRAGPLPAAPGAHLGVGGPAGVGVDVSVCVSVGGGGG